MIMLKPICLSIIFIFLSSSQVLTNTLFKFPLKAKYSVQFNSTNCIEYFKNSIMETNFCLGTPKQCLNLKVNFDSCATFIMDPSSGITQKGFNSNASSTFQKINVHSFTDIDEIDFSDFFDSEETIYLNNQPIQNFQFAYAMYKKYYSFFDSSGGIGFKIKCMNNMFCSSGKTLIQQLKDRKLLQDYTFSIKYKNDKEGEITIGDYPHNIDPFHYSSNYIHNTSIFISDEGYERWIIKFTNITMNETTEVGNVLSEALINPTSDLIECNKEYGELIYRSYLGQYIQDEQCEKVNQPYSSDFLIKCKGNMNSDLVKKFPKLSFYSEKMNFTFELNGEDVFKEINNELFLLIIFTEFPLYWRLGKPFVMKYPLSFNSDKKEIYYYEQFTQVIPSKQNKWYIPVMIILIVIIGILSYYLIKRRKIKNRKLKMATELIEDDYAYIPASEKSR